MNRDVRTINHGANTDSVYKYLGLSDTNVQFLSENNKGSSDPHKYDSHDLYIFYNNAHAAMARHGSFDDYDQWSDVSTFFTKHHKNKKDTTFFAYKLIR